MDWLVTVGGDILIFCSGVLVGITIGLGIRLGAVDPVLIRIVRLRDRYGR